MTKPKMKKVVCLFLLACLGMILNCSFSEAAPKKSLAFRNDIEGLEKLNLDDAAIKAIFFALKNGAYKVKNIDVDYSGKKGNADYRVEMFLRNYRCVPVWIEPRVATEDEVVESREYNYVDANNVTHTVKVRTYETSIKDRPGHWVFRAYVDASLYLYDVMGGKHELVVEYTNKEIDDKEIDAFQHIVKDFYKKVKKTLKKR